MNTHRLPSPHLAASALARSALTLRLATPADAAAVSRLAQLDSAAAPSGEVLLAVVDGQPVAALSLDTGHAIADPFRHTAADVALLRERAALLSTAGGRAARRHWAPHGRAAGIVPWARFG